MPRVSVRRMLTLTVYTVSVIFLVTFALHMHSQTSFFRIEHPDGVQFITNRKEYDENTEPPIKEEQLSNVSGIATSALRRHGLPWYLKSDGFRPEPEFPVADIWPGNGDRIENQLLIPKRSANASLKKIYLPNGLGAWQLKRGQKVFLEQKCPVDNCFLTDKREDAAKADAILFKDFFSAPAHRRSPNQIWIMYMLECPLHTQYIRERDAFNWTATYRSDSELVAPYEKWVYYEPDVKRKPVTVNYAQNKTKKVAWFVSNCGAKNNRLEYAHALQKFIQVDIYGTCGTKNCPRHSGDQCLQILAREYKFYLAFENSNCRDYITEKFYVNALSSKVLPIVMGAPREDYEQHAPEHSFIHVDDFATPKELADYLNLLDQDDALYNEYFEWRGTGQFINTYFFCRLCAMVNEAPHYPPRWHRDFNEWWRGGHTCINGSWRDYKKAQRNKRQATA